MGLLNYTKFQTVAQLSSYHLDQFISNIGMNTYNLAKYLYRLLKALSE